MKYTDLIERALVEVIGSDTSLAALLRGIDALNHSVPTLTELNDAFREVGERGHFPKCDWSLVDKSAYEAALAENHQSMNKLLEGLGMSPEQQQSALEWRRKLWSKREI